MKIGFIGLGKMGGNMVSKLLRDGHEVVTWTRSASTVKKFKNQISKIKNTNQKEGKSQLLRSIKIASSIKDLVEDLEKPRVIWSMVTVGEATEEVLTEVAKYVEENSPGGEAGDIVIDGGNSFYQDTQKRYERFAKKRIRFLGIGVSGGIIAAKEGYPMMAGGDKSAYDYIKPILDSLAKPHGGHDFFGQGGAGHFVKMIHNGMEYGIMQSLGEGFDVLKNGPYKFDLLKIARLYQKGTLVSGFMLDRLVEVLQSGTIDKITGEIDATGEAQWTVDTAKELGVPAEIIERSLEYRKRSKKDKKIQKSYTAKMVAALRHAFGAHGVKRKNS